MDEFAMGSKTPNVINPINPKCYAGGSSGGTAAAVSSGLVSFGLGSDTGGSIRIPASYCQIVGFRPTTNLISRHGLIELSSNMDAVGIMTKRIEQILPILEVLAKYDPNDMAQNVNKCKKIIKDYVDPHTLSKNVIINISNNIICGNDDQIELFKSYYNRVLNPIKEILLSKNIVVNEIQLPNNNDLVKTYNIYVCAQTRSNLARFRGKKYGLNDNIEIGKSDLIGPEPKKRYGLGEVLLKSSNPEELFKNLKNKLDLWSSYLLNDNSYLILPTHVEKIPLKKSMEIIDEGYVILACMLGLPSITIPIKRPDIDGGESSFQLIGPRYSDFKLLQIAKYLNDLICTS